MTRVAVQPTGGVPTPVQDPKLSGFLSRLKVKNTDTASHKDTVDSYYKYWDSDRNVSTTTLVEDENSVAARRAGSDKLTNHFYDLVTDFYEYGWGMSFHFARMFKETTFKNCVAQHEDFLALKLGLKPGMQCVDVGCGVGGPLREIAKFSGATITGLNNNAYQVERCNHLAKHLGLSSICKAQKGDFQAMPFPAASFDAAYAIEATCHAARLENVYGEIFRVLKPGSKFSCYEWLTTERYNPNDPKQLKVIHDVEEGNSISKLYTIPQCLAALRSVGFEIEEYCDLADPNSPLADAQDPWYLPLKGSYSLNMEQIGRWRMTPIGRWMTDKMVFTLETARLAPAGTRKVSSLLNLAADALVAAGEQHLMTPMFYFTVRKPLNATGAITNGVGH
ncbi:S-adenosyl-L-methionine-dependent methyltransferase [Fimicolochytrium jonesii]|uniref:S-adenosyl-L-methionine-dependent methyltransferase n=1 Tax=Fimicolochytrium jonesii TaxID=1396493 RepID=UPI0022FE88E0|nr:S-adenosyl-L-methionine-dependent methyltransferase [Fimicolochytrium jonesii]KAI8819245.1 S-adenosyl-L-methionine-dependent methyltransferase [Fimicolochytrium jonesii]